MQRGGEFPRPETRCYVTVSLPGPDKNKVCPLKCNNSNCEFLDNYIALLQILQL